MVMVVAVVEIWLRSSWPCTRAMPIIGMYPEAGGGQVEGSTPSSVPVRCPQSVPVPPQTMPATPPPAMQLRACGRLRPGRCAWGAAGGASGQGWAGPLLQPGAGSCTELCMQRSGQAPCNAHLAAEVAAR
jgi:hypothetical protein